MPCTALSSHKPHFNWRFRALLHKNSKQNKNRLSLWRPLGARRKLLRRLVTMAIRCVSYRRPDVNFGPVGLDHDSKTTGFWLMEKVLLFPRFLNALVDFSEFLLINIQISFVFSSDLSLAGLWTESRVRSRTRTKFPTVKYSTIIPWARVGYEMIDIQRGA